MIAQHETTIGDSNADHLFLMEVRRKADGRWVNIQVHADSRLKAAKVAQAEGYDMGGGDVRQMR